jgi:glycosyltransferase involved in cell wall biosynthesis
MEADSMRVGVFSNTYKPVISGVVTSISLLRHGLEERGHEVCVFAPSASGYEDEEDGVYRYPAIDLPDSLSASLAVPFSPRLTHLISTLGLDIVHSQHPIVMGWEAVRVARRQQVPLVYTCHSRYEDFSEYVPLGDLVDPLVKKAIRFTVADYVNDCDLVICPTHHVQRLLLEYGVTRPIEIIPTPVRLDVFGGGDAQWVREQHGLGAEEPVLVYVGRLALEKGVPFLLRAFRHILTQVPGCRLMLVGSGPEEQSLQQQAEELGLVGRVVFTGFVQHAQVAEYLAAADLFLFASRSEVQPLSVLEALAAGLPVVAVRSLATDELLTSGVDSIVTERDELAFAAAAVSLLRDRGQRDTLGRQARVTAQGYSIEDAAGRMERAYQHLIEGQVVG